MLCFRLSLVGLANMKEPRGDDAGGNVSTRGAHRCKRAERPSGREMLQPAVARLLAERAHARAAVEDSPTRGVASSMRLCIDATTASVQWKPS